MADVESKRFQATRESLSGYTCPAWFRDLKFGIYCHWGPQCVPQRDGWYARNMYIQGSGAYKYHVKHYGHPSEFGYKDIIQLWKAERFDADALVALFKEAGAKYFTPVAVHHDNFDLWNSQHTRWNATKMGPCKDIVGLWRDAALKAGLVFGVTTHLSRSYSWFQTSHHADSTGPRSGVPYDGENPANQDLYFDRHDDDNFRAPFDPPVSWRHLWIARIEDLIDHYHPQLMYFDASVPFQGEDAGNSGMEVMAHFYNDNLARSDGQSNGVHFIKHIDDHGVFIDNISSIVHERTKLDEIDTVPWQTEDSIGDWFYRRHDRYKSVTTIIHELIDVVSKNGNFMLNIPPRPDGTLDKDTIRILKGIGSWMHANGEAIYGSRPWDRFGEGAVRFTQKGGKVYILCLKPRIRTIELECLGTSAHPREINRITRLDTMDEIKFVQSAAALRLTTKPHPKPRHAVTFRLEFA
ncbi:MAG TPA: alpha-L-fucosidase [Candidatus Lokiarchaeia archaeon]|nr:alpha-L-fucosidase [Candidatus Lokiarchaeia archaeon]